MVREDISVNISIVNNEYARHYKRFERAIELVKADLKNFLEDTKNECVHYITSRVKSKESILAKLSKQNYSYVFDEMHDIAGIRVVCHNQSDIDEVVAFIISRYSGSWPSTERIVSDEAIDKEDGYSARHITVRVSVPYFYSFKDTQVEIQLRTIAQDLFATLSHRDIYKLSASSLPDTWITKMKLLSAKLKEVDKLAQELKNEWMEENIGKTMKDQLAFQV